MAKWYKNKSKRQIKKELIKSCMNEIKNDMDKKEALDIIKSSGKYGEIFVLDFNPETGEFKSLMMN